MKQIIGEVTLTTKDASGNETDHKAEVKYMAFETLDDILAAVGTPEGLKELIENANYAINLKARAPVRQTLAAKVAGPDKAIEKAIKDMVKARAAMGKPITEEAARALLVG